MMSLREQFLWMSFVHGEITIFMEVPRYDSVGGLLYYFRYVFVKSEFFEDGFVNGFSQFHQIQFSQHFVL